ncbi:MAG: dsRBD fold-containing protein [archaeon]
MVVLTYLNDIEVNVVYQSSVFTIAKATGILDLNGKTKIITAEGIARRSYKDLYSQKLGEKIAKGRALTALTKKASGRKIRKILMG